jgi:hypothetical protein
MEKGDWILVGILILVIIAITFLSLRIDLLFPVPEAKEAATSLFETINSTI